MRERIAIIFGGKSVEHDISIITGLQCLENISKKYDVLPIYITHKGQWYVGDNLWKIETYFNFLKNVKHGKRVTLLSGEPYLLVEEKGKYKAKLKIDCALLATHGKNVEDGILQGALESSCIPYTSCSVLSSAICMDKAFTKQILKSQKIATPKFMHFYASEYERYKSDIIEYILKNFNFPIIVKPNGLGSSVGIQICSDEQKLISAIEFALQYDQKVIVEDFIKEAKEFACAIVRAGNALITSKVQQMCKGEIYSFEDKYLSKKHIKDEKIDAKLEKRIKNLAGKAYQALECDGVVRVDFLYDEKADILYVNELNTIPGSLAFNLFSAPFRDLIELLIAEAKRRMDEKNRDVYLFNSDALYAYQELTRHNKYSK